MSIYLSFPGYNKSATNVEQFLHIDGHTRHQKHLKTLTLNFNHLSLDIGK